MPKFKQLVKMPIFWARVAQTFLAVIAVMALSAQEWPSTNYVVLYLFLSVLGAFFVVFFGLVNSVRMGLPFDTPMQLLLLFLGMGSYAAVGAILIEMDVRGYKDNAKHKNILPAGIMSLILAFTLLVEIVLIFVNKFFI